MRNAAAYLYSPHIMDAGREGALHIFALVTTRLKTRLFPASPGFLGHSEFPLLQALCSVSFTPFDSVIHLKQVFPASSIAGFQQIRRQEIGSWRLAQPLCWERSWHIHFRLTICPKHRSKRPSLLGASTSVIRRSSVPKCHDLSER